MDVSPQKTMDSENNSDEVKTALKRYETAFNTNDAAAMNALFAKEASFVNFGGRLVVGRDDLYQAQVAVFAPGGPLADVTVSYIIEHLVFMGSAEAVVHVRQRSATPEGNTDAKDPMEALFTMLLRKLDGAWQIQMGQNTPVT